MQNDGNKAMRRLALGAFVTPTPASSVAAVGCSGSFFEKLSVAPPNAIFNTKALFKKDPSALKMNLGIGAYRDNSGKPYPLPVVRRAEELLLQDKSLNKEYLPITGHAGFVKVAQELIFGKNSPAIRENRVAGCQSLSGTGGLRLGMEFVNKHVHTPVYASNPSWGNHPAICREAGVAFRTYRYWDAAKRCLNIDGMLQDLSHAPEGSVVLLHACAHNPTGVDPTQEQWKAIARVCKQRNLLPFFDSAYQGFASGNLDKDAWAVRYFVDQGFEMILSQSFAKNFGLYNERCGTMNVVCRDANRAKAVKSQVSLIIRPMYSNPPVHGARIVEKVLTTPALYAQWKQELSGMSVRINDMRVALKKELDNLRTPGTWDHITSQIGMFTFTGLTKKQCQAMKSQHHVYLLDNGRISMAGINTSNVRHLAKSIDHVTRNC